MEPFKFSELKYERPDYEDYKAFYANCTQQIGTAASYEEYKNILFTYNEKNKKLETMVTISQIRNTLNTTDEFYENEVEFNDNELPVLQEENLKFEKALLDSPWIADLKQEYGEEIEHKLQLDVDSFQPELIPYLQQESKLTTQYQKLMATAKIPFNGEVYNLYGIQKFFENPDRSIRKQAFAAYSNFYHENEETMEEIFGNLVDIRNKMGQSLGFDNYIPLGYKNQQRLDYGEAEVASFREQVVEEIVPLCEQLYKAQAKRIGVDSLKVYDEAFIFPDGNAQPAGDDDFMVEQARNMYHEMSKETGEFIDFMIEHELMDLQNKPNKASTGYQTDLALYDAPFVFSCFNHTIGDMQVLTHELGHAFAAYQAFRHQPLFQYLMLSTDLAEIHSMSMEQFAYPYAENFFGADADKFRFAHLQEAITFVPFGVAVDEFQHIMYAHPELSPKERTLEWHKLELKYMPWRTYEDDEFMERGGFWYHKLHIFLYPFYYINYTLTTMGAMEFKKRYEENKEAAWNDYMTLCNVGGSLGYLNTLKAAHLRNPFEAGSVKEAMSYAKKILLEQIAKEEK